VSYQSYDASRKVLATGVATAISVRGDVGSVTGSPKRMLATVDFGATENTGAVTTVSNFMWKFRANTGDVARPVCCVVGRPDVDGLDDEDALLDQVNAVVTNIDGDTFDIVAHATGLYEVQITGE
jgi:hypothetical protein